MSKKHFIALADVLRDTKPRTRNTAKDKPEEWLKAGSAAAQWDIMRDALANFCQSQSPNFNRSRWLGYINGERGPSGGEIK
jgi:hypothetical protein